MPGGGSVSLPSVVLALCAGIPVRNYAAARRWYVRLLGSDPAFLGHTEAAWDLAEDRSVYVVQDPERAGHALVSVFVDDLERRVARASERGIEPNRDETYGYGVCKVTYRDPDGNEFGFGVAPPDGA